ncbi:DNA-binding domain-containing protein [Massilia sp. CF038]|uniref:HvfC/BufC N-terminal domain-containing protein n=1 Tax=Massilia sp. CF038 TaxID=1881045 RepID=UPI0009207575|nr:DNA-binding domain-containing protein [Massilia sp. CF038]SHG71952.1 hypothetical protein SAMN05428948_1751 [Massilia sp. CF038]
MKLATLQRQMRSWLIHADEDSARRLAGTARGGLHVYQNNYRSQLTGCLEQTFPRLRSFIGATAFQHAAVAHINRRPPQAWTLDAYGERFVDTLRLQFPDNPDLHELAWIEWAMTTAFVARDAAPVDSSMLAGVNWERARLVFTPSLALASVATNAAEIWIALENGEPAPEARMLATQEGIAIWRRGFGTRLRRLQQLELETLHKARGHRGFTALCALLAERLGEEAGVARAGAMLADWLANDMIIGVEQSAATPTNRRAA